jgi:hypothetical protein
MSPDDLDNAVGLRDTVAEIDVFLKGMATWQGPVDLSFGSYECTVEGAGLAALVSAIETARSEAVEALRLLGVEME